MPQVRTLSNNEAFAAIQACCRSSMELDSSQSSASQICHSVLLATACFMKHQLQALSKSDKAMLCSGAKVGGHSQLTAATGPFGTAAPFPAWLWLLTHGQALHDQPSTRLVLLWSKQGQSSTTVQCQESWCINAVHGSYHKYLIVQLNNRFIEQGLLL